MRRDFQIAIILALATVPCGAWLAVTPEYLHLKGDALAAPFWGGFAIYTVLVVLALAIALRAESQTPPKGHRRRMTAIIGMAVCGFGFLAFAILFFAGRPSEDRVAQSPPLAPLPIVKAPIAEVPIAQPPATIPPPPIPSEKAPKEFVDTNVTPEFLVGLYEGQTTLGAETLASKYIGKWISVSGPLLETMGGFPFLETRTPVVVSFATLQGPTVIMIFYSEWIERLAMIPKNQNIFVHGQIKEIGRSKIILDHCELIDPNPTTNAPKRPRRRRSPREKRPS